MKFTALKNAEILKRQSGGLDDALERKILLALKADSAMTQKEIALETGAALRTVQRKLKILQEKGVIQRKGGKRYGYWEIREYGGDR